MIELKKHVVFAKYCHSYLVIQCTSDFTDTQMTDHEYIEYNSVNCALPSKR